MAENFDDKVHQLLNIPRPKPGNEQDVKEVVKALVDLCEEENVPGKYGNAVDNGTTSAIQRKWIRLLLSLLYKRFHNLSPEQKELAATHHEASSSTCGDGERLIFYAAIQTLFEIAASSSPTTEKVGNDRHERVNKALQVLTQLSPHVGGSRDVCYLIGQFVTHILQSAKHHESILLHGNETSESIKIARAVDLVESKISSSSASDNAFSSLAWLLDFAGDQLDEDLKLIQEEEKKQGDGQMSATIERAFPSTLHVFIPHNKRGRCTKKKISGVATAPSSMPTRHVVNAACEILIWSRSMAARKNGAFSKSYEKFRGTVTYANDSTKEIIKSALMTMQTIIRKLRQKLNNYARNKGFMLTDLFVMDPSRIELKQVLLGKIGDLTKLTALASKKMSTNVLRMIHARFASDPRKVTKFQSIGDFIHAWLVTSKTGEAIGNPSEAEELERSIQVARLSATIQYLRDIYSQQHREEENSGGDNRSLVIASMDRRGRNGNHIAAILVACSMAKWPLQRDDTDMNNSYYESVPLLLGQSKQILRSFEDAISLFDGILSKSLKIDLDVETFVGGEGVDKGVATTKAVLNVIDRHVLRNESGKTDFLLFTSANLRLPVDIQKALTAIGCCMHCHDSDSIGERLERENARKGDITISLAWDTFDDLDLHVFLPSGEEIFYGRKMSKNGLACLDVDMNAGVGKSEEPVENIFVGDIEKKIEAECGEYKVVVQNYSYRTAKRGPIPWRVVIDKNGQKESFWGECEGTGEASNQVACTFQYRGRTIPFPDEEKLSFDTCNTVNLTTSTGQTIESISELLCVMFQLKNLDEVRALVERDGGTGEKGDNDERPILAPTGTLEITNRERLDILLTKLPKRFRAKVTECFGGINLVDECVELISHKMVADRIPLSALSAAGYPREVVDAVKIKLTSATAYK